MMRTLVHQHLLLPAYESGVKRRSTYGEWRSLNRSQWWQPERLATLQLQRLRALIAHAAAACPYFHDTWGSRGLHVGRLTSIERFSDWPTTDRETVRAHSGTIRSAAHQRLIRKSTGGSSGVPLEFFVDPACVDRRMAAWHRGYAWASAAPGTRQLWLWGASFYDQPWWRPLKDRAYQWLYQRKVLDSFRLAENRILTYLDEINEYGADVIVGYVSALYELARGLEAAGLRPRPPRTVIAAAEKLYPFQRELIERVFGAPVFETYGCREFMLIGAECESRSGLHMTAEHLLVEVVDDLGRPVPPGVEGNVAITDLQNHGFPFIRYLNGDRAIAGVDPCPCGRGLPVLAKVTGRHLDVVYTPAGRRIPGEFFPHLMRLDEFKAVKRFQVVQEAIDTVTLSLVLERPLSAAQRFHLDESLGRVLGLDVAVTVREVDDIPLTPSGKLRVVVNRLASPPPSLEVA